MRKIFTILTLMASFIVAPVAMAEPPSNDDFAQAEEVTLPYSDVTDTSEATVEVGEPVLTCDTRPTLNTIWYSVTVDEDQRVFGDTFGSDYDTVVAIFVKESPHSAEPPTGFEGLRLILCEDFGIEDVFSFYASAEETYYVQIGGHADQPAGTASLNLVAQGRIAGNVTNESGEPLGDICVFADPTNFSGNDYYQLTFGYGRTLADGTYEVGGLRAGEYMVTFVDCNPDDGVDYMFETYNDKQSYHDADPVTVEGGETTAGIDAVLSIRPTIVLDPVDLAITSLEFENVQLKTDSGDVGYSGYMRRIHVSVANLGENDTAGLLRVSACPETTGPCKFFGPGFFDAPAGGSHSFDFDWNAFGSVGDMNVTASVCVADWESYDTDYTNDVRRAKHYALVGGTGFGVSNQLFGSQFDYYGCAGIFVVQA